MQNKMIRRISAMVLCLMLIASLSIFAFGEAADGITQSRFAGNYKTLLKAGKDGSFTVYTGDRIVVCGLPASAEEDGTTIELLTADGEDISGGWSFEVDEEKGIATATGGSEISKDMAGQVLTLKVTDASGTPIVTGTYQVHKLEGFRKWWEKLRADFILNFIQANRWKYLWDGLGLTLIITLCSGLFGTVLGSVIAAVRATFDMTKSNARITFGRRVFAFFDWFCRLYLTVIRGTPVVVQLMIIYFVIFASSTNGIMVASLAFGLNSGAYVAEIVRGGIMSIDYGQFEAGRSLGLNYLQTMRFIILPQTLKAVLPSLANEIIALLKETSVAGYVALQDLTKAGDIIRSRTYSPFLPLIAVALIYLVLVIFFTKLVGMLERSLRKSEH